MTEAPYTIPGTKFSAKTIGEMPCPRKIVEAWPDVYGGTVDGDCLAPEIRDGDRIVASPSAPLRCGDYALLYRKEGGSSIKRLVIVPDPKLWGSDLGPESEICPILVVEMTNPSRTFFVRCDTLDAVHAVLYVHKENA